MHSREETLQFPDVVPPDEQSHFLGRWTQLHGEANPKWVNCLPTGPNDPFTLPTNASHGISHWANRELPNGNIICDVNDLFKEVSRWRTEKGLEHNAMSLQTNRDPMFPDDPSKVQNGMIKLHDVRNPQDRTPLPCKTVVHHLKNPPDSACQDPRQPVTGPSDQCTDTHDNTGHQDQSKGGLTSQVDNPFHHDTETEIKDPTKQSHPDDEMRCPWEEQFHDGHPHCAQDCMGISKCHLPQGLRMLPGCLLGLNPFPQLEILLDLHHQVH